MADKKLNQGGQRSNTSQRNANTSSSRGSSGGRMQLPSALLTAVTDAAKRSYGYGYASIQAPYRSVHLLAESRFRHSETDNESDRKTNREQIPKRKATKNEHVTVSDLEASSHSEWHVPRKGDRPVCTRQCIPDSSISFPCVVRALVYSSVGLSRIFG